jgi:nucleoside-diphosphate-sugar epimerase
VATAVLAALDRSVAGVLDVVDGDPVPIRDRLPAMAELLHAPRPRRVPSALARPAVGDWDVAYLSALRGADNARARMVLDRRPRHRSWREGLAHELTARVAS